MLFRINIIKKLGLELNVPTYLMWTMYMLFIFLIPGIPL